MTPTDPPEPRDDGMSWLPPGGHHHDHTSGHTGDRDVDAGDGIGDADPIDLLEAEVGQARAESTAARAEAAERHAENRGLQTLIRYGIAVVSAVSLLVSLGTSGITWYALSQLQAVRTATAAQEQQDEQLRSLAEAAARDAAAANAELQRRGQAPVDVPDPQDADPSEVLVASATAHVLADLARTGAARLTPAEYGAGIASYLRENPITPVGPSPSQIAEFLAGYLATNPPPSGPSGPTGPTGPTGPSGEPGQTGQQGPPPTAEQIQSAFLDLIARQPDTLCPRGGVFALVEGAVTAAGTAYSHWTCLVDTTPSPTGPPAPTTAEPPGPVPTGLVPTVPPLVRTGRPLLPNLPTR